MPGTREGGFFRAAGGTFARRGWGWGLLFSAVQVLQCFLDRGFHGGIGFLCALVIQVRAGLHVAHLGKRRGGMRANLRFLIMNGRNQGVIGVLVVTALSQCVQRGQARFQMPVLGELHQLLAVLLLRQLFDVLQIVTKHVNRLQ